MKKLLFGLTMLFGVAASAPASAQYVVYPVPVYPVPVMRYVCQNVPVAQYVTVWTVYGPVTQLVYGYQVQCYWTY